MPTTDTTRRRVKTTCPRDCYDACGMVAVVEDGRVRKVLGDPDHAIARGALCGKCAIAYNGVWRDPSARLTTPLRRIGAKGDGAFAPISWEEALAAIADRLSGIVANSGPARILHAHYTGTVGLLAGWFPTRFFAHLGATEVDPDSVCNKAGHMALDYVLGTSLDGFDPESASDAATILVWGANPSHSAPHMHKHWLRETPARVIVIDPVTTGTASAFAQDHVKLRPGTDAALAFGLMHVARRENLLDEAFVARSVLGYDAIEAAIEAATPEAIAALTGVPAETIADVARAYARGPSMIWLGQGMQRTRRGGNAFRAIAALAAITGQIGKTGAGLCYMNGPATRGIDMALLTAPEVARDPGSVSHMDLARILADPARAEAFFTWNCNPLASSPDQASLRAAMAREDLFTVACDVFPTDTVAFADIVLPAASFLECDDIVAPYFHHTLSAQVKVEEPPGEALPNAEIFRRLAAAMGYDHPALFETDESLLSRILAATPFEGDFAALAAAGTVRLHDAPRIPFADGIFPTPSGRIEIASARAQADGLPLVPEPHADGPPTSGRLRILSPACAWQMNASYANDPGIARQIGPARVHLHPDDAAAAGLADGDPATLENEAGRLDLAVRISEAVQPGVALVYKGRWPGREPAGANVNVLHAGAKADLGGSTAVHSLEATLVPAGGGS
ncbi:molybdopterin-dependent oxidoreductase [Salinarimonas sp.]|uniref:molybdopterin-containing oxidoreductase family protein n=1 Tax=Salinarimonas sp. TaxID=2766526 RepID=UPI00391B9148